MNNSKKLFAVALDDDDDDEKIKTEMKSFVTFSTLILSFVIHAVITGRLEIVSRISMGNCSLGERPLTCQEIDYFVVETSK